MTTKTQNPRDMDFIHSKPSGTRGVENGVLLSGEDLKAGAVLGLVLGDATAAAKSGGNTGNGTFVIDATNPTLARAMKGVYTLRCIEAAANGGVFRLENPEGTVIGDFTISGGAGGTVTVDEQVKGVLTDGSTDFAVGDGFDITVPDTGEKYEELDTAAVNGANIARAFLGFDSHADGADLNVTVVESDHEIVDSRITWPSGITAAQKTDAKRELAKHGFKFR